MQRIRIIPVLLLMNDGLYKTIRFRRPVYIGDPINTVRIFNDKGADELVLLGIDISRQNKEISFSRLRQIASEAFMPMSYGGGIRSFDDAQKVLNCGFEKVIINSHATDVALIEKIAHTYGSQSVVISMDIRKSIWGHKKVFTHSGKQDTGLTPEVFAKQVESAGAGEIMLNAIYKDGTWTGYDGPLIRSVSDCVNIPVIALGGASGMKDFREVVTVYGASAVAAGSCFVFQKKGMGVLIHFPQESLIV